MGMKKAHAKIHKKVKAHHGAGGNLKAKLKKVRKKHSTVLAKAVAEAQQKARAQVALHLAKIAAKKAKGAKAHIKHVKKVAKVAKPAHMTATSMKTRVLPEYVNAKSKKSVSKRLAYATNEKAPV